MSSISRCGASRCCSASDPPGPKGQDDDLTPETTRSHRPRADALETRAGGSPARKAGAGGRTRTGTALSRLGIFVPATAFAARALHVRCGARFGVWTIPSPLRALARFRCCPSSLYTFAPAIRPKRLARDCLSPVSPSLGSSASRVSPRALKDSSPLRLPVSPRPRMPTYTLGGARPPTGRVHKQQEKPSRRRFSGVPPFATPDARKDADQPLPVCPQTSPQICPVGSVTRPSFS